MRFRRIFYFLDQCLLCGKISGFYSRHIKYFKKAYKLTNELYFPPHSEANKNIKMGPYGELLAVGGDLSIDRLILGYKAGVYPLYFKNQPILWWTSEIRCVYLPGRVKFSKKLRRIIRKNEFILTVDEAFSEVVNGCAEERKDCTWLVPERIESLMESHRLGYTHSFEVWDKNELVGGLFGVVLGSYFSVLSMFTRVDNASKVGMIALVIRLFEEGFAIIDCGFWPTEHLRRMGTEIINREEFLYELEKSVNQVCPVNNWRNFYENWDLINALEKFCYVNNDSNIKESDAERKYG